MLHTTTPKRISSFILSVLTSSLLLLVSAIGAQAQQKKHIVQPADTVPLFRGVAVSADVVGVAQLAFSDYGQYEAALRVNLKDKFFPVVELGYGKADAENVTTGMTYKTSAPYFRVGLDYNLLKNKHDDYRVYGGLRYAFTSYKYDAYTTGIKDPVWGDDAGYRLEDVKCNCHWMEAVVGVDAKIIGPLRLGWILRYRRRLAHNDGDAGNAWYIPGFGTQCDSRLDGTFNIIIEI